MNGRHVVRKQTLELGVTSEAEARDLHVELSQTLAGLLAPRFDEVFSAACPSDAILEVDRIELDLGTLPREGIAAILAETASERLATILGTWADHPTDASIPSTTECPVLVRRLTMREAALDRLLEFLESGALSARDGPTGNADLEAGLLLLLEEGPTVLAQALRILPSAGTARRLARQFTGRTVLRLVAMLDGIENSRLETLIAEWVTLLTAHAISREAIARFHHERSSQFWREWIVERLLATVLEAHGAHASDILVERLLVESTPGRDALAQDDIESLLADAERLLPAASEVREVLVRIARTSRMPTHVETPPSKAPAGDATTSRQDSSVELSPRGAGQPAPPTDRPTAPAVLKPAAATPAGVSEANRESTNALTAEATTRSQEAGGLRTSLASSATRKPDGSPTRRSSAQQDAFWVGNAGLVILWPFLADFLTAVGLVERRRFVDEAARERAVLLMTHLCDGAEEWSEPDLLLGKILCVYPRSQTPATRIELAMAEREEVRRLLESVPTHWAVLKSTSIAGLRSAFLRRAGTLRMQETGWKLEIPRAAHDVLLDKLPWGIGLVLLPWLDQPVYVEW